MESSGDCQSRGSDHAKMQQIRVLQPTYKEDGDAMAGERYAPIQLEYRSEYKGRVTVITDDR